MAHLLLFKNPDWKISLVAIEDDDEPQLLDSMVFSSFIFT